MKSFNPSLTQPSSEIRRLKSIFQLNKHQQRSIGLYFLLLVIACTSLLLNKFVFHYQGNHYFPNVWTYLLLLLLILLGCYVRFDENHLSFLILCELILFYLMIAGVAIMTIAAQYTPFKPIDKVIIEFEAAVNLDLIKMMTWTNQYPAFKALLVSAYASLIYQIALLPLFMILIQQWQRVRAYCCLMLISTIIGFSFYYFFPTTAPASNLNSLLFSASQHATGIKFNEIHAHLLPTTIDGGLIALPSFHVIWAWFALYLIYTKKFIFYALLPINLLLVASCVLLGWHYFIDLIGAAVVIFITHYLHQKFFQNVRD